MTVNPVYQKIGHELNLGLLKDLEPIQALWSNYGQLLRLSFEHSSVIVKHITLPEKSEHPKGWNTDLSHQRKLHSYQVETNWYEYFTKKQDKRCLVPKGLKTFQNENECLIVMEDLASLGLTHTTKKAQQTHLKSCLHWLANFHAKYMNVKSEWIWQMGTYWHLDTRPDELEALEDTQLKKYAQDIDNILNSTKFQTIVHGDAKLANFCFNEEGSQCAAVDFQYVGHGCGMKDLIYFMSSAVDPKDCAAEQEWVLDTYFEVLDEALKYYQPHIKSVDVKQEWRPLFEVAWADFVRFLKGWSPTHYKVNDYSNALTKKVLEQLKKVEHNV